jgi:hypothetical protein
MSTTQDSQVLLLDCDLVLEGFFAVLDDQYRDVLGQDIAVFIELKFGTND